MRQKKLCEHAPNQCAVYRHETGVLIAECRRCGKYRRLDQMGSLWRSFVVDNPTKAVTV